MRSRMQLFFSLCVLALVMSACSSTTVVSRNERPAQAAESAVGTDDDSNLDGDSASATEAESDQDDGSTEAADSDSTDQDGDNPDAAADDDRGGRTGDEPVTPRELEEAEGFGLGGAEQLSSLESDCETGNDMACDILFEISGFDSPEELTAITCGGRSDGDAIFCTPGITALVDELVFDPESEGLDAIVASCREGDYTACDFLYFRSPFESDFEEIGGSCGDRVQVAVPDCRTFLADQG